MRAAGPEMTRRDALSWMALPFTSALMFGFTRGQADAAEVGDPVPGDRQQASDPHAHHERSIEIYYLEIVTSDVDATCELYSQLYGTAFGDADPNLGGARTTRLASDGLLGVRAPLNEGERTVTRPYLLVEDIEAAASAGDEITVPPMSIPGHGMAAIVYQAGIESGLWQV